MTSPQWNRSEAVRACQQSLKRPLAEACAADTPERRRGGIDMLCREAKSSTAAQSQKLRACGPAAAAGSAGIDVDDLRRRLELELAFHFGAALAAAWCGATPQPAVVDLFLAALVSGDDMTRRLAASGAVYAAAGTGLSKDAALIAVRRLAGEANPTPLDVARRVRFAEIYLRAMEQICFPRRQADDDAPDDGPLPSLLYDDRLEMLTADPERVQDEVLNRLQEKYPDGLPDINEGTKLAVDFLSAHRIAPAVPSRQAKWHSWDFSQVASGETAVETNPARRLLDLVVSFYQSLFSKLPKPAGLDAFKPAPQGGWRLAEALAAWRLGALCDDELIRDAGIRMDEAAELNTPRSAKAARGAFADLGALLTERRVLQAESARAQPLRAPAADTAELERRLADVESRVEAYRAQWIKVFPKTAETAQLLLHGRMPARQDERAVAAFRYEIQKLRNERIDAERTLLRERFHAACRLADEASAAARPLTAARRRTYQLLRDLASLVPAKVAAKHRLSEDRTIEIVRLLRRLNLSIVRTSGDAFEAEILSDSKLVADVEDYVELVLLGAMKHGLPEVRFFRSTDEMERLLR